jgi:hypothetical protein
MLTLASHAAPIPLAFERLDDVQRAHIRQVLEGYDWRIDGKGHAA